MRILQYVIFLSALALSGCSTLELLIDVCSVAFGFVCNENSECSTTVGIPLCARMGGPTCSMKLCEPRSQSDSSLP